MIEAVQTKAGHISTQRYKLSKNEQEGLDVLRHSFNVVLAGDYQMSKLVPYWGQSPQPASTYYISPKDDT